MIQNSSLPGNTGGATANRESGEEGGDGGVGEIGGVKTEVSDRNFAGNRWPQEETLALLKIRSEMSSAFRDPGVKAPLWEEVSRKLSELGYNRSAKKCKEKFENIYKYHRRTKEVRSCRSNGKAYKFFDQLEALEDHHSLLPPPSSDEKMNFEVQPISIFYDAIQCSAQNLASDFNDASTSTTSSSSGELIRSQKKKRKLVDFFERLMRQVIEKQENFQKQFLEAMEKCEKDRIAREEAWRIEELARIERERELLVQERSIAAEKDAAVLALLQKFSGQVGSVQLPENPLPVEKVVERQENSNGGESYMPMGSSRWPKDEVEALIRVRTDLDLQYQGNGTKGPFWEEISARMKRLGYDRSAKRCKEKWENMNKYFKRVKESNKKRPEDSKTCPYFQQLDALYKEKSMKTDGSVNSGYELKPEELLMHMMSTQEQQQPESAADNRESEKVDQNHEENGNNEEEGGFYQMVVNNPSPMEIIG
ncbi:hypothetical protein SLA2020_179580 [Shorea laevis]